MSQKQNILGAMQLISMWHKQLRLGPAINVCVNLQNLGKKRGSDENIQQLTE